MVIKPLKLLYGAIVLGMLWLLLPFALEEPAQFLVYEKPLTNPDIIIVLGGDAGKRTDGAAALYHKYHHPKLVMTSGSYFLEPQAVTMKRYMVEKWKIPTEDISTEIESTSTYENAVFTYPMIKQSGFKRILIVTSDYHTRRSFWIFKRIFKDPTIQLGIQSTSNELPEKKWWKDAKATETVILEWIKTCIYWARY